MWQVCTGGNEASLGAVTDQAGWEFKQRRGRVERRLGLEGIRKGMDEWCKERGSESDMG